MHHNLGLCTAVGLLAGIQ